ncbi:MAG: phosphotransferase, partial [Myxococcota bacterium]
MTDKNPLADSDALISPREGEGLDTVKLQDFLRGKLEGAEAPLTVEQFGGGHANLTYLLRFGAGEGGAEYVLRRPPIGPVAKSAHDMGREYRALSR